MKREQRDRRKEEEDCTRESAGGGEEQGPYGERKGGKAEGLGRQRNERRSHNGLSVQRKQREKCAGG